MPMTAWINRPGVLAFLGVEGIWWLAALGALVVIVCGLLLLQQRQKVRRAQARRNRGKPAPGKKPAPARQPKPAAVREKAKPSPLYDLEQKESAGPDGQRETLQNG